MLNEVVQHRPARSATSAAASGLDLVAVLLGPQIRLSPNGTAVTAKILRAEDLNNLPLYKRS